MILNEDLFEEENLNEANLNTNCLVNKASNLIVFYGFDDEYLKEQIFENEDLEDIMEELEYDEEEALSDILDKLENYDSEHDWYSDIINKCKELINSDKYKEYLDEDEDEDELDESVNQLKDLADHNKKAKKGPVMTINKDAGNNEENVAFFNRANTPNTPSTNVSAGNACESIKTFNEYGRDEKTGLSYGINEYGELYLGDNESGYTLPDTSDNRRKIALDWFERTGLDASKDFEWPDDKLDTSKLEEAARFIDKDGIAFIHTTEQQKIFKVLQDKNILISELEDYMYQFNDALKLGFEFDELLDVLKQCDSVDEFAEFIYLHSDKDKYYQLYPEDKKVVGESINIKEALNKIDINTMDSDHPTDLLNMYESVSYSDVDKKELATLISKKNNYNIVEYVTNKYNSMLNEDAFNFDHAADIDKFEQIIDDQVADSTGDSYWSILDKILTKLGIDKYDLEAKVRDQLYKDVETSIRNAKPENAVVVKLFAKRYLQDVLKGMKDNSKFDSRGRWQSSPGKSLEDAMKTDVYLSTFSFDEEAQDLIDAGFEKNKTYSMSELPDATQARIKQWAKNKIETLYDFE
ncbi:hypothetical protein [uncultured Clostridium sp.]|uniref:hypothetical protein n=1 Tax=uncultured Clostridium sp. TaxID=59620 RepID=UPI00261DA9AB|nr:hypothetical protein [uncultured Clostridium sp.]